MAEAQLIEREDVENRTGDVSAKGQELLDQVKRAEVTTAEDAEKMTDLVKYAKQQKTKSEEARKALVKPLNDHVKFINNEFKTAQEPLTEVERIGRDKLNAFQREQDRIAREESERRRREEEEQRLKEAEEAQAAGDEEKVEETLSRDLPEEKPKTTPTRGNFGSSSTRRVWKHKLVDLSKVPDEYKMLDERKVKDAIRNGARDISGLEIYEDVQTVIR